MVSHHCLEKEVEEVKEDYVKTWTATSGTTLVRSTTNALAAAMLVRRHSGAEVWPI